MPRLKEPEKLSIRRIRFATRIPQAGDVVVTGDFTGWDPAGIPLHPGPSDEWHGLLHLEPGAYEYRLRVDGEWRDDPLAVRRVPNPFGGENGVLVVG
jgi:1,4-alpha-glucan branching enzyme